MIHKVTFILYISKLLIASFFSNRATSMSIISLFSSIMATLMIGGWGIAQSKYGLESALMFIGVLFGIGVTLFIFSTKKQHKPK